MTNTSHLPLVAVLACAILPVSSVRAANTSTGVPAWGIGPFTRPPDAQPVIKPDPASVFNCPMRKTPVHWEAKHTFNPAAIVKDGKVYVLYRAEDDNGAGIGGFTSRLGLAVSEDGIHFKKMPEPVVFPAEDAQKENEWEGGCEDPRLAETEDGTYVLLYTQYKRIKKGGGAGTKLGMATSKDLLHWTKLGPVVGVLPSGDKVIPNKSASLVCKVVGDRLIAAKINGRYWLYVGEKKIILMSSEDLLKWETKFGGRGPGLFDKREGMFDSGFPEGGPPAILTDKGIVVLYNGKNGRTALDSIGVGSGAYSGGQILFSATDPSKILDRAELPFIKPELPWEKSGQYASGTTFVEGLVLFKNQWLLYYGCADTFVGVATAPVRADQLKTP